MIGSGSTAAANGERAPVYRLFIDEVGNSGTRVTADPNERYLSLTGVIMALDEERTTLTKGLDDLRLRYFGGRPKFFHRKELVNRREPFEALRDSAVERAFNADLLALVDRLQFRAITVVIDKLAHLERYRKWVYDPYHYAVEVMVERYVQWLSRAETVGDVMAESRGGKEDRRLKDAFSEVYLNGTDFVASEDFASRLTSRELKLAGKLSNVPALQFTDLIAHPGYKAAVARRANQALPDNFGGRIAAILEEQKYIRDSGGRIRGWGVTWLP